MSWRVWVVIHLRVLFLSYFFKGLCLETSSSFFFFCGVHLCLFVRISQAGELVKKYGIINSVTKDVLE